jgi:phosphopantothenoylcysteine decarboxylase/phosphopantothenate--cysteine ligase
MSDISITSLHGREILLGVSGSIAAYKAAELTRLLVRAGAKVRVVMTEAARQFIAPLTFFALTGKQVYCEMFGDGPEVATAHIELARRNDLVIVAPATARTIARIANGLAEDLLSTAVIAADTPIVIAPAMNAQMYAHPAVQNNISRLASWPGYAVAAPTEGELACGEVGLGRLADPADLLEFCAWILSGGKQDLRGERFLITAGPTFEDIDPVRFLSNRSTGKMGFALAKVAARRGADVTLISSVSPPTALPGCRRIAVRSALDMSEMVHRHLPNATTLVMVAAVADYRPATISTSKIKKGEGDMQLVLTRNPDILASLPTDPNRITVGFAAETDDLLANAAAKLQRKRLDLIAANDVRSTDSGFASDLNRVILLSKGQQSEELPLMSKERVAEAICDRIAVLRKSRPITTG